MSKFKNKKILKILFIISLVPKVFTIKALATYYISNRVNKDVFTYQYIEPSCNLDNQNNKYVSGYILKNNKLKPIYSDIES